MNEFIKNGSVISDILKDEIKSLPDYSYAIRSSTSIEDSETHSFAGQFLTLTSVRGYDNILNAIKEVWKSAASDPESDYRLRAGGTVQEIRCAVIIQKMIVPLIAGVCFSKNPVNNLKEIVIESVEGKGEDLVQKGVTPYRWRFKGKLSIEGPENYSGISAIRKVATDSVLMKKLYKRDVDVEWAYDGEHIYYLQIRAIQKRDNITIYSNRMVREMLPGQIKPLVWDVNIPLFNSTFLQLVSEITGPLNINPVDLTKPFHYRVYMNMSMMGVILSEIGLPADSLEFMLLSDKAAKARIHAGYKTIQTYFQVDQVHIFQASFRTDLPY